MSIEIEKREKINKKLKFLDNKINFVNLQTAHTFKELFCTKNEFRRCFSIFIIFRLDNKIYSSVFTYFRISEMTEIH